MQFNTTPRCCASVQQCYFYFLITPQYTRRLVGAMGCYAIQPVKSGRRSTGSSVVDVMAASTQLNGSK
jgi:hypothetical protein